MRRRSLAALAIVLLSFAGARTSSGTPVRAAGCDTPLTYDVVRVDPGHHVSRAALIALLEKSERLWEAPAGKNLLRYEPGGTVHVSLVYDHRQVVANEIAADDATLARSKAALARQEAALRSRGAAFKARLARFNQRVSYWNARGGARPAMAAKLRGEASSLHELGAALDRETLQARTSENRFNAGVSARNAFVQKEQVQGSDEEALGQAQVGGTEMSIIVLAGTAKDEEVIAHEFGHILGLGHIPGDDNIMNPFFVKVLSRASAADLAALRAVCASR